MKKPDRLKFGAAMGMALALVFYAGTGAWAQLHTDVPLGHIKIQTALETDWAVHTAGKDNRNNNNNNIPGSGQGFSTNGNDLQAAVGRIDPLITFRTRDDVAEAMRLDNVDVYLHFRFWGDAEQFINGPSIYEVGQGVEQQHCWKKGSCGKGDLHNNPTMRELLGGAMSPGPGV
jgi:hypothetical protein